MSKLELISGNIDIKEFPLKEGDNFIGRDERCTIVLDSVRVSRQHALVTISLENAQIKDLKSANGTFVNDDRITERALNHGDRVTIGDFVFEYKTKLNEKFDSSAALDFDKKGEQFIPSQEKAKEEIEKEGFFSSIYSKFNLLEWRVKLIIFIGAYVFFSYYFVTDYLITKTAKQLLIESYNRSKILVRFLAEKNKENLYLNNDLLLDVESVLNEKGVIEVFILDNHGRVRAPIGAINKILNDPITKETLLIAEDRTIDNFPPKELLSSMVSELSLETNFILAHPIRMWNENESTFKNIGVAKITFNPKSVILEHLNTKDLQMKGLIIILIPAFIIFLAIYLATTSPINRIREELEAVIKGYKMEVEKNFSFRELAKLVESINRGMQKRAFPLSADEKDFSIASEKDESSTNKTLELIINTIEEGIIITNTHNKIITVNDSACAILRLPQNGGIGLHILEVIPDKDVLNEINDIINKIINKSGESFQKEVDYGGPGRKLIISAVSMRKQFGELDSIGFVFKQL